MSFHPPEQYCPRCRYPVAQSALTCAKCGLALSGSDGTPRLSRSFHQPPWQSADFTAYDTSDTGRRFGNSGKSGPAMYRPGGQPAPDASGYRDAFGDASETSAGFYEDEDAQPYTRSRPFRSHTSPSWKRDGSSWQQGGFGAPNAYPGNQWHAYDEDFAPPDPIDAAPQHSRRRGMKLAMLMLALLVVLGGVGAAVVYILIQISPTITVTSKYSEGGMPAGTANTLLHLSGSRFAAHSTVSFLLDGQPEPGRQTLTSDQNGVITGDLTVTTDWALGQHTLTARDASSHETFIGQKVIVVSPGEAGTLGPKGSPADDTPSFTINVTAHTGLKGSGMLQVTLHFTLVVTGQPDPAGGKVCNPKQDTGRPHTSTLTSSDKKQSFSYTTAYQCTGTYKGGMLTYTEIISSEKMVDNISGRTCTLTEPFASLKLTGAFISATEITGDVASDRGVYLCNQGRGGATASIEGNWSGVIAS